ncbi:choice-of-anchor I family protein [Paenibacillus oenotherae]|uniref:Choice-of-anchor I family protein n=1 Tax=Paenibacillus oenotherae TaxID=1435645 RepID=A0ABS7D4G8_9BACL|nr:choice-of-anchor I family protein [Paenibacillus oenotherae]MBW7474701.1 choice-of-anchor I family protein [Paenibacillus oenotherae]
MKKRGKRILSLLLAAELLAGSILAGGTAMAVASPLAGTPYAANGSYDVTVPHIFINQVYGGNKNSSLDTGASVSNGFIELYNPTESDVVLDGWSLHYAANADENAAGTTGAWEKLELTGTIKAHSSYLITGKATGASAPALHLLTKGDQPFDRMIYSKSMKVALMSNQNTLSEANPFAASPRPEGYVDMVGTGGNDPGCAIDGYEYAYPTGDAEGKSKKKGIVRKTLADTDNNKADFEQIDYLEATPSVLSAKGPRSSSDGPWTAAAPAFGISTETLADANVGTPYTVAAAVYGGTAPYSYSGTGLPAGIAIDAVTGVISGTPAPGTEGIAAVTIHVTDSSAPPAATSRTLSLNVKPAVPAGIADTLSVEQIGRYSVGVTNKDGGVAEIVKYNKDNGKFYLVNGATVPPTLDIVTLAADQSLQKEKSVDVKPLAETSGFTFGDLTSVDINTSTKQIFLAVQEADHMANGKILVLDYEGNLLKTYETGVQPDMIKATPDGKYVLTANEAEPRTAAGDPEGSVTIVDTTTDAVVHVKFDDPTVIDDLVHIRGASHPVTGKITGSSTNKADALFDLEPEYITLSADHTVAYVSLQENNAIAVIDIPAKSVTAVKGLGYKNLNDPANTLDLVKDDAIKFENVPFLGMYMPDGIASHTYNGKTYLFSANEGDVTEWPGREGGTTIKDLKASLDPASPAAVFLNGKTAYDKVEVAGDMSKDAVYMYGGRSFSIWDADTMAQVYDSGNDLETITAQRLPGSFNASNSKTAMDDRSGKKGPEPEYVAVGEVGNKVLAFVGLERIGGVMTYDVTNPNHPVFANYINTRVFAPKDNINTDTGPEGLEFIPAQDSPTGLPLLLVANEVGGTVTVLQLNVTKVALDKESLWLSPGDAPVQLNATVIPAAGSASSVTWSSSDDHVAVVDASGRVTPVAEGTAVIRAVSADGFGVAEAAVTVGPWKLTVMHTNDTHAHLADAPRRATLVKQVREEAGDSLLLDAGDVFSGDLYFTKWFGLADLAFMNYMGYDAMTFGNHEFDQGTGVLASFVSQAQFPIVSSNVDLTKDSHMSPLLKAPRTIRAGVSGTVDVAGVYPYVVLDVNGRKVGVFGLTTEDTKETSSPGKDVVFNEAAASAADTVAALEAEGINMIIALSHLGYSRDKELANVVEGIDLIVGGHTHTKLDAPDIITDSVFGTPTVVVQANEWGKFLGRVDLSFDNKGILLTGDGQLQGSLLPVNSSVAEDETAKSMLAPYDAELEVLKKQVIGSAAVVLDGERKNVRAKETNLGNFIADGMLARAKALKNAHVAIMNGGGIRASIDEGDITMGELRTVMPFGNTLYVLDVTGQALKDGLENGISGAKLSDLPGKFPQVAGMRFKWDPSQPAGSKVYDVEIKSGSGYTPINLTATYRLATNSFVAGGGDGYASFAKSIASGAYHEDLGYPDYEIFMEYVSSLGGTIAPAVEGRIVEKAKSSGDGNGNGNGGSNPPVTNPEQKPDPKPDTGSGTGTIELSGTALQITETKNQAGGTIHKVAVKAEELKAALTKALAGTSSGGAAAVVVNVPAAAGAAEVELPAEALAAAAGGTIKAVIVIHTGAASYELPLSVLNLNTAESGSLGSTSVKVSITPVEGSKLETLKAKAQALGADAALEAVLEFKVAIATGGGEKELKDFGKTYVSRFIYLPSSANPAGAAAVMYDEAAGQWVFVPGVAAVVNGKPAMEMKRPGNSIYSVIHFKKDFADLSGHWAEKDVETMASKLIVNGVNENDFAPGKAVTRAEFTAMVVRGLGLSLSSEAAMFTDVAPDAWYAGAVSAAVKFGLINGKTADKFAPDAWITRAEMAVMIARAITAVQSEGKPEAGSRASVLGKFKDASAIPQWAAEGAALLVDKGIMQGSTAGAFAPADNATRAQGAVILLRALKELDFVE